MSIIIMLILISILVLVHEAGHFMAARFFNIRVDKFGFGLPIGPTLYETKWGNTKILIHAFLLGGYVAFPDDEEDCDLPADSPERFLNKPVYQRLIVVSAGVISNVIFAFLFVLLTAQLWGSLPSGKYDIFVNDIIAPKQESIWQSGIQKNDKIYTVNGTKINSTRGLLTFIRASKKNDGKVNEAAALNLYSELKDLNTALTKTEIIPKGITVKLPPVKMEAPVAFSKMELNGVKQIKDTQVKLSDVQKSLRDRIQKENKNYIVADGTETLENIAFALADNVHPVSIEVVRNNKIIKLKEITPNEKGVLGIKLAVSEILVPTKTAKQVIARSYDYLYENTYMMIYGLYEILTGKIPLKDLHGIVAITKVGGDIIHNSGIFSGLLLTAIISMDLAIVNFLPIPALDGGHVMFLIIEKIRGKRLDDEVVNKIGNAGFLFLIILMVFVVFNDIYALIMQKL